ncbi:trehalase-like domain-containing protein [Streptomyces sp. RLB1-33]
MAEATPEAGAKDSDRTYTGPRGTGTPGYLPIAEHGLIGDLRSAALVGTNGTIDWYCCPRFDAPSVFASILDAERGGSFELAPDVPTRTKQFYFPDTNVLMRRLAPASLRPKYGTAPHTVHAEAGQAVFASASLRLALTSTVPIEVDGPDVWSLFKLHEGETAVFTIDKIGGDVAPRFCAVAEAEREFNETVRYWRRWLSQSRYRGRWRKWSTAPPSP